MYKVPVPNNHFVLVSWNDIFNLKKRGDHLDLSIYNLGTRTGELLPRPPMILVLISFKRIDFDSSTGHCTFLLGSNYAMKKRR